MDLAGETLLDGDGIVVCLELLDKDYNTLMLKSLLYIVNLSILIKRTFLTLFIQVNKQFLDFLCLRRSSRALDVLLNAIAGEWHVEGGVFVQRAGQKRKEMFQVVHGNDRFAECKYTSQEGTRHALAGTGTGRLFKAVFLFLSWFGERLLLGGG